MCIIYIYNSYNIYIYIRTYMYVYIDTLYVWLQSMIIYVECIQSIDDCRIYVYLDMLNGELNWKEHQWFHWIGSCKTVPPTNSGIACQKKATTAWVLQMCCLSKNYPLVSVHITVGNHHVYWENPLCLWAIFNSYIKLPEGTTFPKLVVDNVTTVPTSKLSTFPKLVVLRAIGTT